MDGPGEDALFSPFAAMGADAIAALETPCYVFDPAVVVAEYRRLRCALGTPLIVSVKANPNIDLLMRCAHAFADGVELASLGELNVVFGRVSAPKFVNTPALDTKLLTAAFGSQATPILDSLHQVSMSVAHVSRSRSPIGVGLRINAASLLGDPGTGNSPGDHFGLSLEDLGVATDTMARSGVELRGLHVFTGSNSFGAQSVVLAQRVGALLDQLRDRLTAPLQFVSLGGGFSEDWSESDPRFIEYRRVVAGLQEHWPIMHESGRAIFTRGGTFVTRVIQVKRLQQRTIVVCDGGIAHCFRLAQTERVIKRRAGPRLLRVNGPDTEAERAPLQFVGNSCNSADIIGECSNGFVPSPGDLVLFTNAGAYHTYSPNGFLSLGAPRYYLVS